jgi:hypothetical protein
MLPWQFKHAHKHKFSLRPEGKTAERTEFDNWKDNGILLSLLGPKRLWDLTSTFYRFCSIGKDKVKPEANTQLLQVPKAVFKLDFILPLPVTLYLLN